MNRSYLVAIIILVLVLAVGISYVASHRKEATENVKSEKSTPIKVSVIEVKKGIAGLKHKYGENEGSSVYQLLYVEKGREGYLIKVKVTNEGTETYGLTFVLITSSGKQLGRVEDKTGTVLTVADSLTTSSYIKDIIQKAIDVPADDLVYATMQTITSLAPGASVEMPLFYGLLPGDKPVKLHIIAKGIKGGILEFDVKIPGSY